MKRGLGRPVAQRPVAKSPTIQVRRILVTTDFSRSSLQAIRYALAVSLHFGAEVHLLHVVDTTQYSSKSVMLPLVSPPELSRPLLKTLQAIALKCEPAGTIHVMKPREGRAYKKICEAAREVNADLILIATHGYTGFKHAFLGSTAERVIQHASRPVFVVRQRTKDFNERRARLSKILVPIDFSSCSEVAFNCAIGLAREFRAELLLVHVIDPFSYPFGDEYAALHTVRLMEEARASASKEINAMAVRSKLKCSIRIIEGSPAAMICNVARRNVDLIVISTHGWTGLGHVLIGSVAEQVVRHATCPVLVLPARAKLKAGPLVFAKSAKRGS